MSYRAGRPRDCRDGSILLVLPGPAVPGSGPPRQPDHAAATTSQIPAAHQDPVPRPTPHSPQLKIARLGRVKFAIDVPPFGELSDPRVLAGLAAAAEERGWDGFFVWDHVVYRAPVRAVADPWVALAAVACATSTMRIGTMITPLSRRRVHKLARETVTLDLLSSGRLTLGVGGPSSAGPG